MPVEVAEGFLIQDLGFEQDWILDLAEKVVGFTATFPWFAHTLASLGVDAKFSDGCVAITRGSGTRHVDMPGDCELHGLVMAITRGRSAGIAGEAFRAFLLLGAISHRRENNQELALDDFASAIRGVERRSTPLKEWLQRTNQAGSLLSADIVDVFIGQLGTPKDPSEFLVRKWRQKWVPFLNRIIRGSSRQVIDAKPTEGPPNEPPVVVVSIKPGIRFVTLVGTVLDPIDAPEAEDESAPSIQLVELHAGQTVTAIKRQRIANHDLDHQHPDVASSAELRVALPVLWREAETGQADKQQQAIMLLMTLATGRSIGDIQRICLVEFERDCLTDKEAIALDSGIWQFPALTPDSRYKPAPTLGLSPWVSTEKNLRIQLPHRLVEVLGLLHRGGGWSDLALNLGKLEDRLRKSTGAGRRLTLSRWRLRYACELQSRTGDIAATMLLTGNTLSHSSAPLHYYSPQIRDVNRHYREVIWPLLDAAVESDSSVLSMDSRIGAEGLVEDGVAREGFSQLQEDIIRLRKRRLGITNVSTVIELHNHLVTYVLSWLQTIGSHRPTKTLMCLRRWDFDLLSRAAILSDKRIDAEHMRRYVAMTDGFANQLCLYLAHLKQLGRRLRRRGLEPTCQRALDGSGPLFFLLDTDCLPVMEDLPSFKQNLPAPWQPLQSNWHRTWLATRLREAKADALDVATQLGHLEAAQHPFATESPCAPTQFSQRLGPFLQSLESILGLVPLQGMSRVAADPLQNLPPLRDWGPVIAAHEREVKKHNKEATQSLRRKWRETNEAAIGDVIDTVGQIVPRLGRGILRLGDGVAGLEWADPAPATGDLVLQAQEVHEIRHKLSAGCEDTALMAARHNMFWWILWRARRRWGWKTPSVKRWKVTALSEPSPFLSDQMLARLHMEAVRSALAECQGSASASKRQAWQVMMLMVDGMSLAEAVVLAKEGAGSMCRLSKDTGELLIGQPARILSGLSAVIAASMQPDPTLDMERLNTAASALLAEFPLGSTRNVLQHLESTISAAQRVEQSPLARIGLNEKTGSARLPIAVAADFLSARKIAADGFQESGVDKSPPPGTLKSLTGTDKHQDRRDYRRLLSALNVQKGAAKHFPLTDVHLFPQNVARAGRYVQDEMAALVAQLPQDRLPHYLGQFALQLLTDPQRDLRLSSIHTYLSALGTGLIKANSEHLLSQVDGDEIAELYAGLVEGLSARSGRRTAAQCVALHRLLVDRLGLPPVDLRFLYEIEAGESGVDANLLSSREADQVFHALSQSADRDGNAFTDVEAKRFDQACAVTFVLLRRCGLRISEGAMLRHRDLLLDTQGGTLFVRANSYSWLKSAAARRVIPLDGRITEAEHILLSAWQRDEVARMGSQYETGYPLFGQLGDPRRPLGIEAIRTRLLQVLRQVTGRFVRVHHLRHGMVNEAICAVVGRSVADAILVPSARPTPALVRRLKLQAGHRSVLTTIGCYFHAPDILTARYPLRPSRNVLALAAGASTAAIDKQMARMGGGHKMNHSAYSDRWHRVLLDRLPEVQEGFTDGKSPNLESVCRTERSFDAVVLDRWTRVCRTESDLTARCRGTGLTEAEIQVLIEVIHDLRVKYGYRLLSVPRGDQELRPVRLPRRHRSQELFDGLLEANSQAGWVQVADIVLQASKASHRHHLRVSRLDAERIRRWCNHHLQQDGFTVEIGQDATAHAHRKTLQLRLGKANATTGLVRCAAVGWVYRHALDYAAVTQHGTVALAG